MFLGLGHNKKRLEKMDLAENLIIFINSLNDLEVNEKKSIYY